MQPTSSYQPFLIGEGKSKTGYFTYLDSWVKPQDAFDELLNAYVYRGSIYQRQGMTLFPSAFGNGALVYTNYDFAGTGNGATRVFAGTLPNFPVIANTNLPLTVYYNLGGTLYTATDNSTPPTGTITGPFLSGTIVYATGAISLTFAVAPANNSPIVVSYSYVPADDAIPTNNPIMGITTFRNETNDTNVLVVMDTRRMSYWNSVTKSFFPIESFQQYFYQFPGPNTFTSTNNGTDILVNWNNIAPYTVIVQSFGDANGNGTVHDIPGIYPLGTFSANGNITGGRINYATGAITINFAAPPTALTLVQITANLQGDYFTGNNTNFFNYVNWAPAETDNELYVTNNVDNVTRWDGTYLSRPAFATIGTGSNAQVTLLAPSTVLLPYIQGVLRTLDVKVYKNRLLFFRPTLLGDYEPHGQGIFFSAFNQPLNFVEDIAGNGGDIELATGDWIMAEQLLRDGIVVFANNSTWFLRDNASSSLPFRADQINSTKSTNAPYGSVAYDVTASSMGARGLIQCDGVGVDRYDINIIDFIETINNNAFGQCFAKRYDFQNVTWMLYPSKSSGLNTSDQVLVYNFLEQTWAIFEPNMGFLNVINNLTITGITQGATTTITAANTFTQTMVGISVTITGVSGMTQINGLTGTLSGTNLSNSSFVLNINSVGFTNYSSGGIATYITPSVIANTLSCLGLAYTVSDLTWNDFAPGGFFGPNGLNWNQADFPWNYYLLQDLAPTLLAGDENGYVYITYSGPTDNAGPDSANPVQTFIKTKRLNPFAQEGQKARFGYVDIYYEVNPAITLTVCFYNNNANNPTTSFTFNLDAPPSSIGQETETWAWKRFYPNLIGEFIQIEINSQIGGDGEADADYGTDGPFKILGMILWAAPAGRLTPGGFI